MEPGKIRHVRDVSGRDLAQVGIKGGMGNEEMVLEVKSHRPRSIIYMYISKLPILAQATLNFSCLLLEKLSMAWGQHYHDICLQLQVYR